MNRKVEEVKIVQENNNDTKAELDTSIKSTNQKEKGQTSPSKTGQTSPTKTGQKSPTKTVVIKTIKQGAGLVTGAGDFIGRLGTLLVMIVTSINTGTIMVTSFLEGVYWKGAIHAALLAFIHLPVIVVIVWSMGKAKVQAIYRKVRPSRPGEPITVTEVENETIVYEETIEVQGDVSDKNINEAIDGKKEPEKVTVGRKEVERKEAERLNQLKMEEKMKKGMKTAEMINKAFEMV